MKHRLIKYSLLFFTSLFTVVGFSQQHFVDDSLGYSVDLPDDFTYKVKKGDANSLVAYSQDSSLIFKAGKFELWGIYPTSMDYLKHLEEVLFDSGYSENVVEPEMQFRDSLKASKFNADDMAYGIFGFEKDGEYFIESVCLYRKGRFIYMVTTAFPSAEFNQRSLELSVLTSSFKLKD